MTLSPDQAIHFGPYRIYPGQRLVMEADQPLRLGRRAMDILLILLEHAGEVVSKQTLIARVWPKNVVEDINLRVHMAALRKALGDFYPNLREMSLLDYKVRILDESKGTGAKVDGKVLSVKLAPYSYQMIRVKV